MRVLVTNDDGVQAPGLAVLARHVVQLGHDVLVVAPASDRSGSAAGLGPVHGGATVTVTRARLEGLPGIPVYAVDAPPGLCALSGCAGLFGPVPEVVLSGVNAGWNTGRGVLHSGTVGAALTAASAGVPAAAISCGLEPHARFDTAARVAGQILAAVRTLPSGIAANLNVPDVDGRDLGEIRLGTLARTGLHSVRLQYVGNQITVTERIRREGMAPDTDADLVLRGHPSLTLLRAGVAPVSDPATAEAFHNLLSALNREALLEDA
ncbi:MAG: 5'/3'-nucleotidase SurE [Mycobacteriales bacterium]